MRFHGSHADFTILQILMLTPSFCLYNRNRHQHGHDSGEETTWIIPHSRRATIPYLASGAIIPKGVTVWYRVYRRNARSGKERNARFGLVGSHLYQSEFPEPLTNTSLPFSRPPGKNALDNFRRDTFNHRQILPKRSPSVSGQTLNLN